MKVKANSSLTARKGVITKTRNSVIIIVSIVLFVVNFTTTGFVLAQNASEKDPQRADRETVETTQIPPEVTGQQDAKTIANTIATAQKNVEAAAKEVQKQAEAAQKEVETALKQTQATQKQADVAQLLASPPRLSISLSISRACR